MASNHSNWYLDACAYANKFNLPSLSPKSLESATYLPKITLFNNYISLKSDLFALYPAQIYGLLLLASIVYFLIINSNYNLFLTSLFSFSEKEVNALDDLLVTVLLVFLFFFFNFFGCFGFFFNVTYSLSFSFLFTSLCVMLVSIPTVMLYNFGFYFIISIRGAATTLSYFYELILDYVNLISFALRLCIQLVRIIVIGVAYYLYNHLFFVYNYLVGSVNGVVMNSSFELTSYIIMWARLVFEVGHTFAIFGIQLIAFAVMILWLFQFLFTLFFSETMEHSFLSRQN